MVFDRGYVFPSEDTKDEMMIVIGLTFLVVIFIFVTSE